MPKTQKELNKEYYEANKERLRAASLARYEKDRLRKMAYMKEYQKTYKRPVLSPEQRAVKNKERRERYANDPEFRERKKLMAKTWAKASPAKKRARNLKVNYGLGQDQYEAILASQNGGCAICGAKSAGVSVKHKKTRKLSVDHCHKTNAVRGLLCHHCNFGLGHFMDNPDLLTKAVAYLTKSSSGAT